MSWDSLYCRVLEQSEALSSELQLSAAAASQAWTKVCAMSGDDSQAFHKAHSKAIAECLSLPIVKLHHLPWWNDASLRLEILVYAVAWLSRMMDAARLANLLPQVPDWTARREDLPQLYEFTRRVEPLLVSLPEGPWLDEAFLG